jgi:putative transposase
MDRGFAGLPYFAELKRKNKPFVIRLSLNYKKVPLESGEWQVGTGKDSGVYRVVWFSDLDSKVTYCLLTNLPFTVSKEEVSYQIKSYLLQIYPHPKSLSPGERDFEFLAPSPLGRGQG